MNDMQKHVIIRSAQVVPYIVFYFVLRQSGAPFESGVLLGMAWMVWFDRVPHLIGKLERS